MKNSLFMLMTIIMATILLGCASTKHFENHVEVLMIPNDAGSDSTGVITGVVLDAATGDPLHGCNVFIDGTHLGDMADEQGNFTINDIPFGDHDVKVQMIGYAKVLQNVRVDETQTTHIILELQEKLIVGTPIEDCFSCRPLVDRDQTGTVRNPILRFPFFRNSTN